MNFRDFLFETPLNIFNIDSLDVTKRQNEIIIDEFNKLKEPFKKIGSFNFFETKTKLFFSDDNGLILCIIKDPRSTNTSLFIKYISKFNNEKNLSFIIFNLLLSNNIFKEIITGSSLSTPNQKAHLNNIKSRVFKKMKFFIRKNNNDKEINFDELFSILKNEKEDELIVLKESQYFKSLSEMFEENINNIIEREIDVEI